jgi:hypothetical protein
MTEEGEKNYQWADSFYKWGDKAQECGMFEVFYEMACSGSWDRISKDKQMTKEQEAAFMGAALAMFNLGGIFATLGEGAAFDAVRKMPSQNKSKRAVRAQELFDSGMTDFADIADQLKAEGHTVGTSERTIRRYFAENE